MWLVLLGALAVAPLSACQAGALTGGLAPIEVTYGDAERQRMDVYRPNAQTRAPILVMVHGGAWRIGDKANRAVVDKKLAYWGKQGWLFISLNYRMLPDTAPYTQAEDVAAALRYIQQHAAQWGGDPERIIAMGHSAGAHLVTLVATDPKLGGSLDGVLGTVSLDTAALDVEAIMTERHPRLYDRAFGDDPHYWRKTSPLRQLHPGVKPLLLVCSTRRDNSCGHARHFASQADKLAVRTEVLPVDLSHGAINSDLGEQSRYTDNVDRFIKGLLPAL